MEKQKIVESPSKQNFDALQAEFEATKAKEIQPTKTKIINLVLISGCGCGSGGTTDIHIEVPEDYDEFSELEPILDSEFLDIREAGITVYNDHFFGEPKDDTDRTVW